MKLLHGNRAENNIRSERRKEMPSADEPNQYKIQFSRFFHEEHLPKKYPFKSQYWCQNPVQSKESKLLIVCSPT